MKETKRKAFNFFRSYYDVYNELSDIDKVAFMDALLDRQFLGVKPTQLKGIAKFAYISQTHSIDSQVKGYEDKTGKKLNLTESQGGSVGSQVGVLGPPYVQEKGEVQEKEKGEVKEQLEISVYEFDLFWIDYEKKGNKKTASERFSKLNEEKRGLIKKVLPAYIKSTPDKQYRKNAEVYISKEAWNDEVIIKTNNDEQGINNRTKPVSKTPRRDAVIDRILGLSSQ